MSQAWSASRVQAGGEEQGPCPWMGRKALCSAMPGDSAESDLPLCKGWWRRSEKVCAGGLQDHPKLDDSPARFTGLSIQLYSRLRFITVKGCKQSQSSKGKGTWSKIQGKPSASFQEAFLTGVTQQVLDSSRNNYNNGVTQRGEVMSPREACEGPRAQGFCESRRLSHRSPLPSTEQNSRLLEEKQVLSINCTVGTNSLGQGAILISQKMMRGLLKSQFTDASKGQPCQQAPLRTAFGAVVLTPWYTKSSQYKGAQDVSLTHADNYLNPHGREDTHLRPSPVLCLWKKRPQFITALILTGSRGSLRVLFNTVPGANLLTKVHRLNSSRYPCERLKTTADGNLVLADIFVSKHCFSIIALFVLFVEVRPTLV